MPDVITISGAFNVLSSLFAGEAGSSMWGAVKEASLKQRAIALADEKSPRAWHVREALTQWTQSPYYDFTVMMLKAREQEEAEQQVVASFIEHGEFISGMGEERTRRATQVVATYFDTLLHLMLGGSDSLSIAVRVLGHDLGQLRTRIEAGRQEDQEGHRKTHEVLDYIQLLQEQYLKEGARPKHENARRGYLQRLRRDCLQLPLGRMGGKGDLREDVTLDKVYINLNTRTPKEKDPAVERASFEREGLLPAREAVAGATHVVLLGDPGSGKSSFVKELLAEQATALLDGETPPEGLTAEMLPVLVNLRDLVLSGLDLARIIHVHEKGSMSAPP